MLGDDKVVPVEGGITLQFGEPRGTMLDQGGARAPTLSILEAFLSMLGFWEDNHAILSYPKYGCPTWSIQKAYLAILSK